MPHHNVTHFTAEAHERDKLYNLSKVRQRVVRHDFDGLGECSAASGKTAGGRYLDDSGMTIVTIT